MPRDFVHLHAHSEFSLLDGLSKTAGMIKKVKEDGSKALAITDHGSMHGEIEFYKKALKEEIKPILGCELYMSAGDHLEKKRGDAFHLTVLAQNLEGYRNLMKIVTIGQTEGVYYKPRVSFDILEKYNKGLIVTSGCPLSLVQKLLITESYEAGKDIATKLSQIFDERFYIEVQRHPFAKFANESSIPEAMKGELLEMDANQKKTEEMLVRLSRELGLPLVATNDSHYVHQEDAPAQDAIVCIQTGKTIADVDRMRYIDSPDFYLKSPAEMEEVFIDLPEALDNTVKIADQVDIQIQLGQWLFPRVDLPKGKTAGETLKELAYAGAKDLFPEITNEITERLEFEMGVIDSKGYSPYFLIYHDMTQFARKADIYINTRGSAAGSLVSYCCGITTVDPLRYNLPFERFLNPFRPSPPDIDLDISDDRRDDMISYLKQKYGEDKVAQICTFGRMLAKAAVRDVGRVLGMPYAEPDRISKMIPEGSQGFPMSLKRAFTENPDLKKAYDSEPATKKLLDLAQKVEGNVRHVSVHAAGVVVAQTVLTDFTPIQKEPGGGDKLITQYEAHACEDTGLIKMDILGIRNLSIMANAIKIIEALNGEKIDIYKIPIEDKKTFEMLARGETFGVFQMGGGGMTKHLMDLRPERVEDLMQMVALYRPGPISFIPEYIRRKHDPTLVKYDDPRMEKFLKSSYGVIVYQDDVLYMAIELAGYTWETADKFRKAIGKKIPEEMQAQKEKFINGCVANGMSLKLAKELFTKIETFAAYGFNKAHAASYGMVSYWTAYLKSNYPVEYMTALLTAESGNTDKMVEAIAECEKMQIRILPPDVNESLKSFTVVEYEGGPTDSTDLVDKSAGKRAVRFGLSAIKNVGEAAITAILAARKDGPFGSLTSFCRRVDQQKCNKKVLESLIKAGAMDRYGGRVQLMAALEGIRGKGSAAQKEKASGQVGMFMAPEGKGEIVEEKDSLPDIPDWELKEKLKFEKELLGFYLSGNPLKNILKAVEGRTTHKISQLDAVYHMGQTVTLAGVVARSRQVMTKKKNEAMAFGTFEDDSGVIEAVVFPKVFEKYKDLWVPDKPLLITGKVDLREDSLNLMVNDIEEVPELPIDGVEEVLVAIPRGTDKEVLMKINQILKSNPGEQTVVVEIPNGGAPKRIKLGYGVNYSDAVDKSIKELIG